MIPAIRKRIDEANNALEIGDGDYGHWIRISIPPSELAMLSDLRKREHIQKAREKMAVILGRMEAEGRGNPIQDRPLDDQRSFGLPPGEDFRKIWGLILSEVKDLKDIVQIRDTCRLFRELLEEKYKIFRLNEVISKVPSRLVGHPRSLFTLRRVCRSTKATVDELLLENGLDSSWFTVTFKDVDLDPKFFRKPVLRFSPDRRNVIWSKGLNAFKSIVKKLEQQAIPVDAFPFRRIHLGEYGSGGGDLNNPISLITGRERENPLLLELRDMFQRFVELAGGSLRSFKYFACGDHLFIYDQLRIWLIFMYNLENLTISGMNPDNDSMVLENPSALQPFPSCVRLKRYRHEGSGFCAPFVAEIFRANPWITDVHMCWDLTMEEMDEAQLSSIQGTLNMLKLERFHVKGENAVPPLQFEFKFDWPLKYLSLTMSDSEEETREAIPSRTLFKFVNTFTTTLEELTVTWKIRDTGGYLDLPKVTKLLWKFWPDFLDFDFMVAMENLQFLDMDVSTCQEINGSIESVKGFIIEKNNLLPMFPALRKIRARIASYEMAILAKQLGLAEWQRVWQSGF